MSRNCAIIGFDNDLMPSHYCKQCWHLKIPLSNIKLKFCENSAVFIEENAFWSSCLQGRRHLGLELGDVTVSAPGPWFNIKMSYQYRNSHCGDKTILWPSYLHNGTSFTGKMTFLYWISPQGFPSLWRRPPSYVVMYIVLCYEYCETLAWLYNSVT